MQIYERYAEIYDQVGQSRFSRRMAQFTVGLLERLALPQGRILDLACGTGEAALHLAQAGYDVVGVDASAAMLERARQKTTEAGLSIPFLHQDMRSFEVDGLVDVVTCFYDSLNYLLHPEELQEVCNRVASALAPGGLLVCDLNTAVGLARDWSGQVYLEVDKEGIIGIHRTCYDEETHISEVHLTYLVRHGETWERFDELHAQRGYARAEVETVLDRAGLGVFLTLDGKFNPPGPEAKRLIYVAVNGEWPDMPPQKG